MEGDLSLSQALGGLRIANPDGGSSPPPNTNAKSQTNPLASPAASDFDPIASQSNGAADHIPPVSTSELNFDPGSYSIADIPSPIQPTTEHIAMPSRKASGQSALDATATPSTVDVQSYPQPSTGAFTNRPSRQTSNPHTSSSASQPFVASPREDAFRVQQMNAHSDVGGAPRRQSSRSAATALQAGVPSLEEKHTDRSYRGAPGPGPGPPNGALPPRRSSRNMNARPAGGPSAPSQTLEGPLPRTNEEWRDRGAATGVRQERDANGRPVHRYVKKGVNDFTFGRTLGEGSYSTVMLGTDRQSGKEYAIKILDKRHIIKEKKVKYVNIEKDTLNRLTEHPGIVRLYYTFQDQASLYFVLDLATGGELLGVLKKKGTFDVECTRFYGAQILDTVDYMHSRGVIHRDLKPENVLLDSRMNIKITDFGTAKVLDGPVKGSNGVPVPGDSSEQDDHNRAVSFVGTAEYVSPELLTEKNAGKASDLWAFGCIIYQLLAGRPPFKAANEYLTFQKIVALEYTYPNGFPPLARDLVDRLLVLDPARRLTMDHVKNHEFFEGIKWGRGLWQQKAPRLKSYQPPTPGPIKLNGSSDKHGSSYPPDIGPSHSTKPIHLSEKKVSQGTPGQSRSVPRLITEIPPPSQLDIEWSPVLTRMNERIIKFSNQIVLCTTAPMSPASKMNGQNSEGSKFSRFFGGGGNSKKRQRLVMATSSGRVLICGDEKKAKFEIPLSDEETSWKKLQDSKGLSYWTIETRDKHFTFEDPKASSSDSSTTSASADDWLEHLERAREMAISQSVTGTDPGDESWVDVRPSNNTSAANTLDRGAERHAAAAEGSASNSRHTLQKLPSSSNGEELRGFKRFSRRASKSGLAAVF